MDWFIGFFERFEWVGMRNLVIVVIVFFCCCMYFFVEGGCELILEVIGVSM